MKIRVRQDEECVVLSLGEDTYVLYNQEALELSKVLHKVGKLAEAYAERERIIYDNAILIRAGANIGLSKDSRILKEAIKEAAYNRDLRRYMSGGVKTQEALGSPVISHARNNFPKQR